MNNMQPPKMQAPQNANDLKKLYQQFGTLLTPQNRQLLGSLIAELDKGQGGNRQQLQAIANQLQRNAQLAQSQMQNGQGQQHGPRVGGPNMPGGASQQRPGQYPAGNQAQQWPNPSQGQGRPNGQK